MERRPLARGTDFDVVFFDGVCGLCDRFVGFVIARDRRRHFRFAALQSGFAERELGARGGRPRDLDTVYVLAADGRLLRKSRAVLFVLQRLGGPWAVLALARVLPRALLDWAYDRIAARRYRIFGQLEACRMPKPDERGLFLA